MTEMIEVGPIITSNHVATEPIRVLVVGAGGTGGRLIPPLMQILRRGDSVGIVDGDHVEDRNLARQNFRTRDIGLNKAEVMARRYRREGIHVDAYASFLTEKHRREMLAGSQGSNLSIIVGCVDNPRARNLMLNMNNIRPSLWIDGGNERRGGQVILSAYKWPWLAKDARQPEVAINLNLAGMNALPQLLLEEPWHCHRCNTDNVAGAITCASCNQPEASCRDRIDLQTVAVNQLSASCILNILSCIFYKVPMMTCGAFFSTMNTISPIKIKNIDWYNKTILPETTYAT